MHGVFYTIASYSAMYKKPAAGLSWWPWIQIGADAVILLLILLGIIKMTSTAKVKVE